jgi:RNA polymerase sigma-70 factor (ECF subfamily)
MKNKPKQNYTFEEQNRLFKIQTGYDFTTMYEKHYNKLVNSILKICRDKEKAEDIASDSFITAFDRIQTYNRELSQFQVWITRIAINKAHAEYKKNCIVSSIDEGYNTDPDDDDTMKSHLAQPEEDKDFTPTVKKADLVLEHICTLPNPYYQVMSMRHIDNMSYQQISSALDTNLNTVKSQIRKGRALIKKATKSHFIYIEQNF